MVHYPPVSLLECKGGEKGDHSGGNGSRGNSGHAFRPARRRRGRGRGLIRCYGACDAGGGGMGRSRGSRSGGAGSGRGGHGRGCL